MMRGWSDAPAPVRQHCEALQAEVNSLRLDLAEARALNEALEGEVWRISARWHGPDDGRLAAGALDLLIQARTLLRRALSPRLGSDDEHRAEVLRDLRVAEAAFGFLLRLRAIRHSAANR